MSPFACGSHHQHHLGKAHDMSTLRSTPLRPGTGTSPVPAASRASTQGWRDPRLLAGVVIVAVCVLLGARVMAAADDTVAVWSARPAPTAGSTVAPRDPAPPPAHLRGPSRHPPPVV